MDGVEGGWFGDKGVIGMFDGSPGVGITNGVVMLRPPHFAHLRASMSVGDSVESESEKLRFLAVRLGLYL